MNYIYIIMSYKKLINQWVIEMLILYVNLFKKNVNIMKKITLKIMKRILKIYFIKLYKWQLLKDYI